MRKLFSLSLLTLASASMFAGGYRVSIQGQKQLAMGHTGVAVVNSAEVTFFNPAGMSFLDKKFNLSVGGSALFAKTRYQNAQFNQTGATDNMGTPFNLYATYKINDWVSAGLAVYTPYGSSVEWDQDWAGAHLVNNIDLKAIFIQPTISFKIEDVFSIGGGPIFVQGAVNFNRNLSMGTLLSDNEGNKTDVTLDATGISATGYNVGMMFKPTKQITLGLDYRSEIIMEARGGSAEFDDVPGFAAATFTNTTFDADLPLPAEITAGISYQATDKWLFAFDYNHTKWGVYKSLDVDFGNTVPTSVNPRNYKDASSYRFGAQYKATEKFTLRAGWYFDESPVQDGYFAPETPRNDSNGYTGGLTYQVNSKLGIDLSFLYLHFDEIDNSYNYFQEAGTQVPFSGTYKSTVFAPGIGVTYGF